MSLRLLPAIIMDDEDDDGNFTKWMSSYWGHGGEGRGGGGGGGHLRERKRSFRRPAKTRVDRRASLPTVSQLDAMKLNRLHAATTASHAKSREDKGEVKPHQRARRTSSDDNGRSKSAVPESRIGTIPELTESFQKRLCLQDKCTPSQNGDVKMCLLCHDNVYKIGAGLQEPHCAHTFHKEAARRSEPCGPCSGSETAATCMVRRLLSDRRRSADEVGAVTPEKQQQQQQQQQQQPFRRQLSLRRHR